MASNWTLTCDNTAAFIPISKNCRNILIILVTGSTEPSYHRNTLSPKKYIDGLESVQKLGSNYIWKILKGIKYMIKLKNHCGVQFTCLKTTLCNDCKNDLSISHINYNEFKNNKKSH